MKSLFQKFSTGILESPLFWYGLVLRLALLPFFGSHYLRDLFIPFIDQFVQHPTVNPWSVFPSHYFPYGVVLLVLLALPKYIGYSAFGVQALGVTPLSLTLIKIPLLFLDFLLLLTLMALASHRKRALLLYYWLSPIVLFVLYGHGQLDIAAMSFSILSLFLLFQKKDFLSSVFFAASLLCKFHVVLMIPFLIAYLLTLNFLRPACFRALRWTFTTLLFSSLGFLPVIFAQRLDYTTFASPEALRVFAGFLDLGSQQTLYLGPFCLLLLLGRLCLSTHVSPIGFLSGTASLFGMLLLTTSTMPGWYLWVLPFLSLFCAIYHNAPRLLFWAFNLSHVVYSLLFYQWNIASDSFYRGIGFTLVQTSLAGMLLALWSIVIRKEAFIERRYKPLVIGVAGDSGSGKNFLVRILEDLFSSPHLSIIEGDDYHKWERRSHRWKEFTHLNPRANDLAQLQTHTSSLVKGIPIQQRHYDHSQGTFTHVREIKPSRVVIVQGLHTLYLKQLRQICDLKIFLAPEDEVRLAWKIKRDVTERGHAVETVLTSFERRKPDAHKHIQPQRSFADWIIETSSQEEVTQKEIMEGKYPLTATSHILWSDTSIFELVEALTAEGCQVQFNTEYHAFDRVQFCVPHPPSQDIIQRVAERVFPDLHQLTRSRNKPRWREGNQGILQLIAACLIRRQQWAHKGEESFEPERLAHLAA